MTPKQSKIAERVIAGCGAVGLITLFLGLIGEAITGEDLWRKVSVTGLIIIGLPLFIALVFVLTKEMLGIKSEDEI